VERDEELRVDDAERWEVKEDDDAKRDGRDGRLERMMTQRKMGSLQRMYMQRSWDLWNVGKRSSGIGSICNKCNEKGLQPVPVTCVGCAECMCYYFS